MLGLFFAAVFIALNGFFVAAEFALVKMHATFRAKRGPGTRVRQIELETVVSRLDRYLSVTQLGITLASLGLGWIGEPAVAGIMEGLTADVHLSEKGERILHIVIVVLAFTLLTFGHVLFGELVPKLIAIQRSERVALSSVRPLKAIFFTFRPLLWILEKSSGVILRIMGLSSDPTTEGALSEEEILGILAASTERSPRGKEKGELIERVLRFAQRTARHAMIPRVDVASLPADTSVRDAVEYLRTQQYSRIVLTKEKSLDDVVGYLYTKDVLLGDPSLLEEPNLEGLRRDVLFVPEQMGLVDVLRGMQSAHTPFAIVVDEYGGTSGIATMEDLLEEIVGEIRDEFDEEPPVLVKARDEENSWDVDARARLDDLRAIGVEVEDGEASEPVGAVMLSKLGRLARRGDKLQITPNATAVVTGLSRRRITRIRVRVAPVLAE